jgi:citrate synthase
MSPIKTAVTEVFPDRIIVKGHSLVELAGRVSFGDLVYLLMRGELPRGKQGALIEAMLILSADHGVEAPSAFVARAVASCGTPVQSAIAAGISACGESHGGAGEAFARLLGEALAAFPGVDARLVAREVAADFRSRRKRIPGLGHRHHDPDPRAEKLLALAREWGLAGAHTALALALVDVIAETSGRRLPLNVDGALGCLLMDIGIHWRYAKALFIIGRTAGLSAHVIEELETGKPFGFIPEMDVEYVGPEEK